MKPVHVGKKTYLWDDQSLYVISSLDTKTEPDGICCMCYDLWEDHTMDACCYYQYDEIKHIMLSIDTTVFGEPPNIWQSLCLLSREGYDV